VVDEPRALLQILRKPPDASTPSGSTPVPGSAQSWPAVLDRLRQYAAARAERTTGARCEFCGAGIGEEHGHVVDVPKRALLCVCRGCYLLFTHDGAGGAHFRAVPTRYALLPELRRAPEHWELLDLPIGLAFFFRNSATGRTTAFYPSPAGATESELPLDAWSVLAEKVPLLSTLAADVEALLVRRTATDLTALIVPIDICYELVGVIRVAWRGLQGGDELWRDVDRFFALAVDRAQAATT
jgi:hypothetical protein